MFTGAINSDIRSILCSVIPYFGDAKVNVACSGNFTIERILSARGVRSIRSNDVSLYSSVIGGYLTGNNIKVGLLDGEKYAWLKDYISPGIDTVATMMLCTKVFQCIDKKPEYYKRQFAAYIKNWGLLHKRTCEKIAPILEEIKVNEFCCQDGYDFVNDAQEDSVVISFPPTYVGGYEKLYKKFDEAFVWDNPPYTMFDEKRLEEFFELCCSKRYWILLRDVFVPEWEEFIIGFVQTSPRSKPVYVYSNLNSKKFLTMPRQKIEPLPLKRLDGEITPPLSIIEISQAQMNLLRSEYLSKKIPPASASVRFAVVCGGYLVGAIGFAPHKYTAEGAYMMINFAIAPTLYKRLSKLVLAAALSKEVQCVLMQKFNAKVPLILTTAFTKKPVSMKYRGLFDVYNKKEGIVNYSAKAGRWTLEEGFRWWMNTQSQSQK